MLPGMLKSCWKLRHGGTWLSSAHVEAAFPIENPDGFRRELKLTAPLTCEAAASDLWFPLCLRLQLLQLLQLRWSLSHLLARTQHTRISCSPESIKGRAR